MSAVKIGVFDSGLGGLTVFRAIQAKLPEASIIYLGDTARLPYGTKSADTVVRYAISCARHLLSYRVDTLVVACNTMSAVALDALREEFQVPVLGVIEPGSRAALRATRSHRVGVIGTYGTIQSGAYENTIHVFEPHTYVFSTPAPLLVPLVEEGWIEGLVPEEAIRHYLKTFVEHDIDTLILGCTHYPVLHQALEKVAKEVLGHQLTIVDSANATAVQLAESLLPGSGAQNPERKVLVTDRPKQFAQVASRFLGYDANQLSVDLIDL